MSLSNHRVYEWRTTPKELHRMADTLERAFRKAVIGDDVPKLVVYSLDNDERLHIVVDQEEMDRQDRVAKKGGATI